MGLAPLEPGDPRRAGPYALRARLGSGGMGQVFLADGPRGERSAVKLLHPHTVADAHARARLARELRTLSRVRGPHLAEVVAADVDAPRPFIVTRYVPGPTLEARVADSGPLDPDALLGLARGLATALAAVHGAGVVHRDLKPGNVICGPEGPTLLDFGIASAVDEAALTRTGEVWGTPAYLAPEQVVTGRAEPASDLHALGATLSYAATGRPLFGTGRADAVMYRVVHDAPAPPDLPGPLGTLLPRLLDRDPARRPTAADVLRALDGPAPDRTAVLSGLAATTVRGATGAATTAAAGTLAGAPGGTRTLTAPGAALPPAHGAPPARAVPPARSAPGWSAPGWSAPGWSARPPAPAASRDPWSPVTPAPVVPAQAGGARVPAPGGHWGSPVVVPPPRQEGDAGARALPAGPWPGRLVGLLVVLALTSAALVAPLVVPVVAYAVLLPLHDAIGRCHAAATERRQRRGPRPTDGLRTAVGLVGNLARALLGAALRLPLLVIPGAVAAAVGFLAALGWGADTGTTLRAAAATLTAALVARMLSPRRQRHAAGARAALRHRAGAQGVAGAALALAVLTLALLAAAASGAPVWYPLAGQPALPGWVSGLPTVP